MDSNHHVPMIKPPIQRIDTSQLPFVVATTSTSSLSPPPPSHHEFNLLLNFTSRIANYIQQPQSTSPIVHTSSLSSPFTPCSTPCNQPHSHRSSSLEQPLHRIEEIQNKASSSITQIDTVPTHTLLNEYECVICYELPVSTCFYPCGHLAICDRCMIQQGCLNAQADQTLQSNIEDPSTYTLRCPICRIPRIAFRIYNHGIAKDAGSED